MDSKIIAEIWGTSLCFWGLFGLYTAIRIRFFIIKRYEKDTNLGQTKYFTQLMPWAKYAPPFFRSPLYSSHLWRFVWYWKKERFDKEKKLGKIEIYADIQNPEQVTGHFTKKEIRRVNMFVISGIIIGIHAVAYHIFAFIWPVTFK